MDKWLPRLGLLVGYLTYGLGVWSVASVVFEPIPKPPLYEIIQSDPLVTLFAFGLIMWTLSKESIELNKQKVFHAE